jgi:diketogulonate reductase-like aldo/keto reductase
MTAYVEAPGARIPAIGLGTWPLKDEACERAVAHALACGYRHVDTAAMYANEAEVGRGLKASGLAREAVWITTKVWTDDIRPGDLQRSAERSLKALGLAAVDLLLIHWPNRAVATEACIGALCDAKRRGLARHVGISNFPSAMMRAAVRCATEPLVTNQVEYHPHLDQRAVLTAARELGMTITSYCPLGRGDVGGVLGEAAVQTIATRLGRTPAQVVLRWHVQQPGVIAVPKSATPARIAENFAVFEFELTDDDMRQLSALARPGARVVNPAIAPDWDA